MQATSRNCLIADTIADVQLVAGLLLKLPEPVVALDVETDAQSKSPHPFTDPLVGIGLAIYERPDAERPKAIFYVPFDDEGDAERKLRILEPGLQRAGWYAHNAQFDALALRRYIRLGEHRGDPRILAYLNGLPEAGLKQLIRIYEPDDADALEVMEYDELLRRYDAKSLRQVPVPVVADYCGAQDAAFVIPLERMLRSIIQREGAPRALKIYELIELPMVNILVDMTYKGIYFDREQAESMLESICSERIAIDEALDTIAQAHGYIRYREKAEGELYLPVCRACHNGRKKRLTCAECGGSGHGEPVRLPFNPASPIQRYDFLTKYLHLPLETETTNELALLRVQNRHIAIPLLLKRTKLAKIEGFLKRWLEKSAADGKLHTQFTNTRVASGRLSSQDPNLQQVTQSLRHLFLPNPGDVIVSGDQSQLELIIAAFMSKDEVMLEALENKWDLHAITAEALYGIPWRRVEKNSPERFIGKLVNYLSQYGGQHKKLREVIEKAALSNPEAGITVPSERECKAFIERHRKRYARYWSWVDATILRTREKGYSETAFGRPRFFRVMPSINSPDPAERAEAERAAVNHAIQGSAADLMKAAMIAIASDEELSRWGDMLLQVHDEIVSTVREEYAERYAEKMQVHMEVGQPFAPDVRLEVDIAIGSNWAEAHK
jgi:DNA polymerase I-like protein with 3'-5' exonuclease and polymerase domains